MRHAKGIRLSGGLQQFEPLRAGDLTGTQGWHLCTSGTRCGLRCKLDGSGDLSDASLAPCLLWGIGRGIHFLGHSLHSHVVIYGGWWHSKCAGPKIRYFESVWKQRILCCSPWYRRLLPKIRPSGQQMQEPALITLSLSLYIIYTTQYSNPSFTESNGSCQRPGGVLRWISKQTASKLSLKSYLMLSHSKFKASQNVHFAVRLSLLFGGLSCGRTSPKCSRAIHWDDNYGVANLSPRCPKRHWTFSGQLCFSSLNS